MEGKNGVETKHTHTHTHTVGAYFAGHTHTHTHTHGWCVFCWPHTHTRLVRILLASSHVGTVETLDVWGGSTQAVQTVRPNLNK